MAYPRRRRRRRSGGAVSVLATMLVIAVGAWFGVLQPWRTGPAEAAPETRAPSTRAEAKTEATGEAKTDVPKGGELAGRASVIDGDTLDIHGQRVRLDGVDAPESKQMCKDASGKLYRCGSAAANELDAWIAGNPVTCVSKGKDRYDRVLGQCSVRGESVQQWLVSHGHALAYRAYSKEFVPVEDKARLEKIGVWSGEFIEPWDWRKGKRMSGEKPTAAMERGDFAPN